MKYNDLVTTPKKSGKRVGRGIAAGQGKTAGRGTKGQRSRTGSSAKPGFEGGQNPLMQRLPKLRGFKSKAPKVENVYTGQLETLGKKTVDSAVLAEAGYLSSPYAKIKLIVKGDLKKAVSVKLPAASASAIAAIEAAGGSFEVTPQLGRPVTRAPKKES